jgi:hypothetical protein
MTRRTAQTALLVTAVAAFVAGVVLAWRGHAALGISLTCLSVALWGTGEWVVRHDRPR